MQVLGSGFGFAETEHRYYFCPAGRLTFQILGAVAEFERELLRERVKAGMAQARRTGKHVGRPALEVSVDGC